MATVVALQSGIIRLEKDVLGPDRVEKHSQYAGAPSVFPGGAGFPVGSLEKKITKQGKAVPIFKGQLFDSNNPIVKAAPSMFGQPEMIGQPPAPAEAHK